MAACVSVSEESATLKMTAEGLFSSPAVLSPQYQRAKYDEGYNTNPHEGLEQVSVCEIHHPYLRLVHFEL